MPYDINGTFGFEPVLTPSDRGRIAARWPRADDFYRQRDDRTAREVSDVASYSQCRLELHIDPAAAADVTVQRAVLVAANLSARWARRITVVLATDVPLASPLRRSGADTLGERLMREMQGADPFGMFTIAPSGTTSAGLTDRPLRLYVGPWVDPSVRLGPDDYHVHSVWWTALGRRGDASSQETDISGLAATAAAAGLAGALGAADLFKRAVGHTPDRWLPTFAWDTWTSGLSTGAGAWTELIPRQVPESLELGNTLLAGIGAIGSAFIYLADLMPLRGALTLFDRDAIEITNLNRSPLFTVLHALDEPEKTLAVADYLRGRGIDVSRQTGLWREHASTLAEQSFDVWISLTNEDGAWAEVPFYLPPVVLHGTTTSGWGFGAGRHIPGREDCTLCRMPRPAAEFRGPCAQGEITAPVADRGPVRASLPFLSTAAAAVVLASYMQLAEGPAAVSQPNDISVDLSIGLPTVMSLHRAPTPGCRGCHALASTTWQRWGGRGRFGCYSP